MFVLIIIVIIVIILFVIASSNNSNNNKISTDTSKEPKEPQDFIIFIHQLERYWKKYENGAFMEQPTQNFIMTHQLDKKYNINKYDVWDAINRYKEVFETDPSMKWNNMTFSNVISDYSSYLRELELYYKIYGLNMYKPDMINNFIFTHRLDRMKISKEDVLQDLNDICSSASPKTEKQVSVHVSATDSVGTSQSTKLNEKAVLDYLTNVPIAFSFDYPHSTESQQLNRICSMLAEGVMDMVLSTDNIKALKSNLTTKRNRVTTEREYANSLRSNIVYASYNYSYLMNIFDVMEKEPTNNMQIDFNRLWQLIKAETKKRVENLDHETRTNSAVREMLSQYTGRPTKDLECDYIFTFLMSDMLSHIFTGIFSSEQLLKDLQSYSSKEVKFVLDKYVMSFISMKLNSVKM